VPHAGHRFGILQRRALFGRQECRRKARKALAAVSPGELWNGFWHGRPGMEAAA